ncbi:hypothetical protein [Streptomyces sp. NBC_00158]|uniref:hypothetical protein n=1 Tax=Streptomyces sp. NBC_00158 TaxID=2903627 RepID=UPI00325063F9
MTSTDPADILRAPSITEDEIAELLALRGKTARVSDAFLVRLAAHLAKAEAEGVINPARHFAEYLGVQRPAVLVYMRIIRNRSRSLGLTRH